jgi:hypothetical protein
LRLGHGERTELGILRLVSEYVMEETLLLIFGPRCEDRRGRQPGARDIEQNRRVAPCQLLRADDCDHAADGLPRPGLGGLLRHDRGAVAGEGSELLDGLGRQDALLVRFSRQRAELLLGERMDEIADPRDGWIELEIDRHLRSSSGAGEDAA